MWRRRLSDKLAVRSVLQHVAIAIFVIAASGAALPVFADETAGMTRSCGMLYKQWRKVATHKAFAASQVIDGLQACGYSFAWESPTKAINSAVGSCKSAASYRNLKMAVCRIVKVQ